MSELSRDHSVAAVVAHVADHGWPACEKEPNVVANRMRTDRGLNVEDRRHRMIVNLEDTVATLDARDVQSAIRAGPLDEKARGTITRQSGFAPRLGECDASRRYAATDTDTAHWTDALTIRAVLDQFVDHGAEDELTRELRSSRVLAEVPRGEFAQVTIVEAKGELHEDGVAHRRNVEGRVDIAQRVGHRWLATSFTDQRDRGWTGHIERVTAPVRVQRVPVVFGDRDESVERRERLGIRVHHPSLRRQHRGQISLELCHVRDLSLQSMKHP